MISFKELIKEDNSCSKVKKTFVLSLASGLTTLMSVILQMVSARVLSVADVGLYRQTFLIPSTVLPFLLMGIPSGMYYVLVRNESRIRAVYHEACIIVICNTFVLSAFVILGGNRILSRLFNNPDLQNTSLLLIPYFFSMVILSITTSMFVFLNRIRLNAKYQSLRALVCVGMTTIGIITFKTAQAGIISNIAIEMIICLLGIFLLAFIIPKEKSRLSFSSIKQLLIVSVPLGVATMLGTLDTFLDKWLISIFMSPEEYAVFSVGAQEIPLINAITGAITTVIVVDMTREAKERNNTVVLDLFQSAAKKTSLILLPLMCCFCALASPFICFLYTDKYIEAVNVFRVYLLYLPIRTVFYGPLMIAYGKSKQIMIRSVIEIIVNSVLSIVLIRLFSAIGASMATIMCAYCISIPINFRVICKEMGIRWYQLLPFRHYFKCFLCSLPGMVVSFALDEYVLSCYTSCFVRLVLGGLIFVFITGLIIIHQFNIPIKKYLSIIFSKLRKRAVIDKTKKE